ncbi:MAG: hypothetical protein U0350_13790 [Caldilineaceae bacterium]
MNLYLRYTFSFLLLALCLSGCEAVDSLQQSAKMTSMGTSSPLPAQPLYVLVVGAREYSTNQLVIVDPNIWQVVRRVPLLNVAPWDFNRDPQGRIWIGYGAEPGSEHRVQVFAPDGSLLKTLTLCSAPYLTIRFAAGRAFVPCLQNGFHAAVAVVDLNSLEVYKTFDLQVKDDSFLLLATANSADYILMAGGGNRNHLFLINPQTLAVINGPQIPASNFETVLSSQGKFLILNSYLKDHNDLVIIDPKAKPDVSVHRLPAVGPLWGDIIDDTLYAYHNADQLNNNGDPSRAISRLNLATGETKLWPLPDHWDVRDIAFVNGEIVLAHFIAVQAEKSGLYRFEPKTGEVSLLVNISGAYRILPPVP